MIGSSWEENETEISNRHLLKVLHVCDTFSTNYGNQDGLW